MPRNNNYHNSERYNKWSADRSLAPGGYKDNWQQRKDQVRKTKARLAPAEKPFLNPVDVEPTPELDGLGNKDLPSYKHKQEFFDLLDAGHQVIFVAGETGCGKSTQFSQFAAEAGYNVTMTQPRIMAAEEVSSRIESEIAETIGDTRRARELVGHETSAGRQWSEETVINVVTDGLEFARITSGVYDDDKAKPRMLIIDEVHEWNANIEMTVACAKKLIADGYNMRVVIMSATMDSDTLKAYFADVTGVEPPVVKVEGRRYPVEMVNEPRSTVAEEIVKDLDQYNKTLVFLPGRGEIDEVERRLTRFISPELLRKTKIVKLHSDSSSAERKAAMGSHSGPMIILATNVAQTSITIPGVDRVVDCGLERQRRFEDDVSKDYSGLGIYNVSRATIMQRRGRTGRECAGKYILTCYDENTAFVPIDRRDEFDPPEVWRTPADRLVLRALAAGWNFRELDLFHPIRPSAVEAAYTLLYELGAIDEDEQITTLGKAMNDLPLDSIYARMVCESRQYSPRLQSHMAGLAAACQELGLSKRGKDDERKWTRLIGEPNDDDFVAQLALFRHAWRNYTDSAAGGLYLEENDLNRKTVDRAIKQYQKICHRLRQFDTTLINQELSQEEKRQLDECVCSGLISTVFQRQGKEKGRPAFVEVGNDASERLIPSKRSIVSSRLAELALGIPTWVTRRRKGGLEQDHELTFARPVTLEQLGRHAVHLSQEVSTGTEWRGGRLYERFERKLYGLPLPGTTETRLAQWSDKTAAKYIAMLMSDAASRKDVLNGLLAQKKQHEEVQRRWPHTLRIIDQHMVERLLRQAVQQPVEHISEIDYRLGQVLMQDAAYAQLVTEQQIQEILQASPDVYEHPLVGVMPLQYSRGIPSTRRNFSANELAAIGGTLQLPDGRDILVHQGRKLVQVSMYR